MWGVVCVRRRELENFIWGGRLASLLVAAVEIQGRFGLTSAAPAPARISGSVNVTQATAMTDFNFASTARPLQFTSEKEEKGIGESVSS